MKSRPSIATPTWERARGGNRIAVNPLSLKQAENMSTPGRIRTHDPLIRSQML